MLQIHFSFQNLILKVSNMLNSIKLSTFQNSTISQSLNESDYSSCNDWMYDYYLYKILQSLGIVLNALCVLIFAQIVYTHRRLDGHMYKYLMVKSFCDSALFCGIIVISFTDCDECLSNSLLIMEIWYFYLYRYVVFVLEIASVYLEIAATFDCFITINKLAQCCLSNIWFYTVIFLNFLISLLFYTNHLFQRYIEEVPDPKYSNRTLYKLTMTTFGGSVYYENFQVAHTFLRDVLPFGILLILNVLIAYTLQMSTQRKKRLQQGNTYSRTNIIIARAQRAQRNKVIMIIMTGINFAIGHSTMSVYYITFNNTFSISPIWMCVQQIGMDIDLLKRFQM